MQFHIEDFRVYLIACVKNTNPSVVFGFPSITFLKYWGYNGISSFIWNVSFSVYTVKEL
jgi:hypothetical protein